MNFISLTPTQNSKGNLNVDTKPQTNQNNNNLFDLPNESGSENSTVEEKDTEEKFNFDNINVNLSLVKKKINLFKFKLQNKLKFAKTKKFLKDNSIKKNELVNNDIESYMSEVDFLNTGNYTKNLSNREKNMIKRFYNLTEKHIKVSTDACENSVIYYNGISIVLLFMLTGGLLGIFIMIWMSFKTEDELDKDYCKMI